MNQVDPNRHPRWQWVCALAAGVTLWVVPLQVPAQTTSANADDPGTGSGTTDSAQLDETELRERLTVLLSGYHFTPEREQLDELAEEQRVAEALRNLASDRSIRPSLRSRAVDALALYPSDRTDAFLKKLLAPPDEDLSDQQRRAASLLRHHAITSIAEMHEDAKAASMLADLLDADERPIRLTAISALGKHAGRPGVRELEKLAEEAEDELVRNELDRYVDVPPKNGN